MFRSLASLILLLGSIVMAPEGNCAGDATPVSAPSERTWHVAREVSRLRLYQGMAPAVEYSEVRIIEGDDPRWASAEWDDSEWPVIARGRPAVVLKQPGIRWLRVRVRWNSSEGRLPAGMHIFNLMGSYELFWDGVLILRSGKPGMDAQEEIPGVKQNTVAIPEFLTGPGEHVAAFRLSTHHGSGPAKGSGLSMIIIDPKVMDAGFRRTNLLPVMTTGALCVVSLASFVMWVVAERRRSLLLLGAMCLSAAALEALVWFSLGYVYPYHWSYRLQQGSVVAAFASSLLLGGLVVEEWKVPRGRWFFLGLLLVDLWIVFSQFPFLTWTQQRVIGAAFVFVLGCSVWAAVHRKHVAWTLAGAVFFSGTYLMIDPLHFIGTDFFQGFFPVLLALLVLIAFGLRADRQSAQEARLTAARLEIELLKKSLQPHFMMNTLTALAQTVEENPAVAVKLIGDLAEEFRSLNRMAGEKRVALSREIELCRAHLRVMRARTDVDWRLETEGVDPDTQVPPALFLTLIENAFTHQRPQDGATRFTLKGERLGAAGWQFTFTAPGDVVVSEDRVSGGTGLRYVRARLEESFPGDWSLAQGGFNGGWRTVIDLRSGRGRGALA